MPNPDHISTVYVKTPEPTSAIDGDVQNSALYITNSDASMEATSDNASIAISSASNLNVSINGGTSAIPYRDDISNNTYAEVTANAGVAQTRTVLITEYSSRTLYIKSINISFQTLAGVATTGTILLEEYTGSTYNTVLQTLYLAADGAATLNLKSPIILTANYGLMFTSTDVTNHSINVNYYY
jgi:hypothetical protein